MPKILVKNLTKNYLGLGVSEFRRSLEPNEQVDLGDLVTPDHLNKNDEFRAHENAGRISVEIEAEATDLPAMRETQRHAKALDGDMELAFVGGDSTSISAAVLNAAVADSQKVSLIARLQTASAELHDWSNAPLTLATAEAVSDEDVGAPTIDPAGPYLLSDGALSFDLVLDTDEGATKTYADGDEVSVDVDITAASLLGYTIATKTFTVTVIE